MKRFLAVFTLCSTALIAASTLSSPAAADGRHDGRRHAGQSSHQTSRVLIDRREHRRAFRNHRDRRHNKFRQHRKRHRYSRSYIHRHGYGYRHRHGYSYGPPRHRYGTRTGAAYALRFDGARFIFRFD